MISAEHNTGVRIADDSPLLSWLRRFAAQVMNKMKIERKFGSVKLDKTVSVHLRVRMTQGIFIGHHGSFVHYQEWSCARQKLDKTDTQ